jgi:HEAT repeat protein
MSDPSAFESAIVLLKKNVQETAAEETRTRFPLSWLSDLGTDQARALSHVWRQLDRNARRDLMGGMEEEAREKFELDFTAVARFALADDDPEVRGHAIRALWECEDVKLADRFVQIMSGDSDTLVRACAAAALAPFVERAELEEIPPAIGKRVEDGLIAVVRGSDDMEVRRRALEAVGFSSNPAVQGLIQDSYRHPEECMRCSAIRTMGRTADPDWAPQVLQELISDSPAMRAEAVRASGELALQKAVPMLIDCLEDTDPVVRRNAIWSLGEIGGRSARNALQRLLNQTGDEVTGEFEAIEDALENAEFQESLDVLSLADDESEEMEDPEDVVDDEEPVEDGE